MAAIAPAVVAGCNSSADDGAGGSASTGGRAANRATSPTGNTDAFSLWAVDDGEKLERTRVVAGLQAGNAVWNGQGVELFALHDETVAFQAVVDPDRDLDITGVSLEMDAPALTAGVELFTEHYVEVPSATSGSWFWSGAAAPEGLIPGELPDALIPLDARSGRGGLPLHVVKGAHQALWVDMYVPRTGVPAGRYGGELRVETSAGYRSIPVQLEVGRATLPAVNPVKTAVALMSDQIERRHGSSDPSLAAKYRAMLHRHRLDPVEHIGLEQLPSYKPYLTGEAYTAANGYTGPGEGVGHQVFSILLYGGGGMGASQSEWWSNSDAYARWFQANAPDVLDYLYLIDEPGSSDYPWIQERAAWHHANPGPGKNIPIFTTTSPTAELSESIDIWCTVADHLKPSDLAAQKSAGKRWWFYNGYRPSSGAETIDDWGIDPRVTPWIAWSYGVELWFYWHVNHWQAETGANRGEDQNVFVDPVTFTSKGGERCNGDGVLMYPGQDAIFADQDRGIAGPMPSIRLKNLRRGQQDAAYLALAAAAGKNAEAHQIASSLVPRAFAEADQGSPAPWPTDGKSWHEARRKLFDLIP